MPEQENKRANDVVQLINFRLRDEEFGVDISAVREITRVRDMSYIPEAPFFIHGVTNLRGQIIPIIDLAKQFDLAPQGELSASARIVVTEIKGQTLGMLVDEVPEILKMPEDRIEPPPELIQTEVRKDYIKGVGKWGDRLIILLDVEKILTLPQMEELITVANGESQGVNGGA